MTSMNTFLDKRLDRIPCLIFDLETTGLFPGKDRVVEISAAVSIPGSPPRIVLDSLVNPGVPVSGTDLHGLTDEDVRDAPVLPAVGQAFQSLAANRLLVGHNLDFDLGFLTHERVLPGGLPGLCTMTLFKCLFDERRSLDRACAHFGVPFDGKRHSAKGDVDATAGLLRKLISTCLRRGIQTPRQLMATFPSLLSRMEGEPLKPPRSLVTPGQVATRVRDSNSSGRSKSARRRYLDEVMMALSDLEISPEEKSFLADLTSELSLSPGELRAIHARVFGALLSRYTEDHFLDAREAGNLADVYSCLQDLGWAPGQPLDD